MYCIGYFVLPAQDILGGGFGKFKMNILSFIDPGIATMGKKVIWSNFIPDIPNNYGEHEGFNYFGEFMWIKLDSKKYNNQTISLDAINNISFFLIF